MALAKLRNFPRNSTKSINAFQLQFVTETEKDDKKSVHWSVDLEEIFYYFPDYPIEDSIRETTERISRTKPFFAVKKTSTLELVNPLFPAREIVETLKETNLFAIQAGMQLINKGFGGFRRLQKKDPEKTELSTQNVQKEWEEVLHIYERAEIQYQEMKSLDLEEEEWV